MSGRRLARAGGFTVLGHLVLGFLILWTLLPLYWMVTTSLKVEADIYGPSVALWPRAFTLANYRLLFAETPFVVYLRNSTLVALATTAGSLVAASLGAYAIARLRFPGRRALARAMVYSYLVPQSLLFIPLFVILVRLGLHNSLSGLVLSYLGFSVPFCTWLLIGYIRSVPVEIEEAALVDGCGRLGVLLRIVVPIIVPALAVVAFFSFTLSWNEFLYADVFTTSVTAKTLPTGLAGFKQRDVFFWGPIMASSLISAAPPLMLYFVLQRWLLTGLTMGAVRG
jgi:multiple sugar transport system permease protein